MELAWEIFHTELQSKSFSWAPQALAGAGGAIASRYYGPNRGRYAMAPVLYD